MSAPAATARQKIDASSEEAGWCVQDYRAMNLLANPDVAVREFPLELTSPVDEYQRSMKVPQHRRDPAPTGEAPHVGATPRGCPSPGNPGHDPETTPPTDANRGPVPAWMPAPRVGATPRGCPFPLNPISGSHDNPNQSANPGSDRAQQGQTPVPASTRKVAPTGRGNPPVVALSRRPAPPGFPRAPLNIVRTCTLLPIPIPERLS